MYRAIVCETSSIEVLTIANKGIWFKTNSPGDDLPVLVFLTWEHINHLHNLTQVKL
jgi:hypothetical protein